VDSDGDANSRAVMAHPAAVPGGEAWMGGYYGLEILLDPHDAGSGGRFGAALGAIWGHPDLTEAPGLVPVGSKPFLESEAHAPADRYGLARPGGRGDVVCRTTAFVELTDDGEPAGSCDSVSLLLPLGALDRIIDTDELYTMVDTGELPTRGNGPVSQLRRSFDEWMTTIGSAVFDAVEFRVAAIGFEADDHLDDSWWAGAPAVIGADRPVTYLVPGDTGLSVFPATW
jgi:hypothetical protein